MNFSCCVLQAIGLPTLAFLVFLVSTQAATCDWHAWLTHSSLHSSNSSSSLHTHFAAPCIAANA
jgi:hypothetical protein